jgi:hypothetical protein
VLSLSKQRLCLGRTAEEEQHFDRLSANGLKCWMSMRLRQTFQSATARGEAPAAMTKGLDKPA